MSRGVCQLSDDSDKLEQRLSELEGRLERLERRLGLASADLPGAPTVRPADESAPVTRLEPPPAPQPVVAAPATPKPPPPTAPPTVPSTAASRSGRPVTAAVPPPPRATRGSLELLIAAKWFAWIGAIVIVLAAAFALREFGADLWSRLTPTAKCLVIAAFGGALIAAGEFVLRRVGRLASVGLFGAGLGVMYLDAYATFQFFEPPLVSREWSFALMAVVALGGFALSLHTRFRTIGILSLIAGYATPILLSNGGHELELLTYLTVLLGIALALSYAAPRSYRTLRYVAIGLHLFVAGLWMLGEGQTHWLEALIFMSIWWTMVLAEATVAAVRRQSPRGNPVAVLIATAAYVTTATFVLSGAVPAGPDWLGIYTAGVAIIGAATAMQFGPGLDGLRDRPKFPMDKLAVALWAQSGVLLIVAAALQFDGYGRSVAWLAMAAASIELGNRLRSRGLDVFGIVVGLLAIIMVATIDAAFVTALDTEVWTFEAGRFGINVNQWSLLCLGAIVVTHYAAQRLRAGPDAGWRPMPVIVAAVGTLYWLGLCAARCDGLAIATGWTVGAVALLLIDPVNRKVHARDIAVGLLLLAAVLWAGIDVLDYRGAWNSTWPGIDRWVVLNGQMAVGVLIAGVLLAAYLIGARRPSANRPNSGWLPMVASLIVLFGLVLETERAIAKIEARDAFEAAWQWDLHRALWITIVVAIGAAAIQLIGFNRRLRPMHVAGYVLIVCAALLWLSFETLGDVTANGLNDVRPFLNVQCGAGLACAAALLQAAWTTSSRARRDPVEIESRAIARDDWYCAIFALSLAGAVGLWLGSLEIARIFQPDRMAMHVGLSVYWGVYAVALVVLGFVRQVPIMRYVGLGLLGVTVVKVLTIDLATVDRIWRIVSLLVTGLLAVGVSVGYARLAPRLAEAAQSKDRPVA